MLWFLGRDFGTKIVKSHIHVLFVVVGQHRILWSKNRVPLRLTGYTVTANLYGDISGPSLWRVNVTAQARPGPPNNRLLVTGAFSHFSRGLNTCFFATSLVKIWELWCCGHSLGDKCDVSTFLTNSNSGVTPPSSSNHSSSI